MSADAGSDKPVIFISHTESDKAIADAVHDAVKALFGVGAVAVVYSTSRELGSGVKFGEDWFQWIAKHVRTATVTLVLLTPTSVRKPWVLWEAGAVYGAVLTAPESRLRNVRPITFQVGMNDVPSPLANSHAHIARGDSLSDVKLLLNEFVEQFSSDRTATIRAAQSVDAAAARWLDTVAEALRTAPLTPSEPIVSEWCERLDVLGASGRSSEVKQLHEWLLVAFGQGPGIEQSPIDIRLHRRLAELYLATKSYRKAAEQFELARKLSPRDLFVLRSLGQTYLADRNYRDADKILQSISGLAPDAFATNVECAALKGRWLREQGEDRIPEARDVYETAFAKNPNSYYLADLLGMSELQLGHKTEAVSAYGKALEIINRIAERNLWTEATAATAAVVSGDLMAAQVHLTAVRAYKPTAAEVESIVQGLQRLQDPLEIGDEQMAAWSRILRDLP
ncbi:toll/interleukin-1 receptor domain-containing protein [Nocardia otitidiscaviarum]|uniref:TIR domain-containing protein n=1 Tax=Nocardia otitidiscaviarum TaxID=1823 RepID=A0A516NJV8_9NOCA|nr:toll/interleukin-1 receptor domain-containing protein [Nocardia otitidiscaviarum]MBF6180204.1 TIR domain-containing protein [Nocardia otitidiscaviarum]MCP9620549.1 TIR domain-containing protein [Nocardia otitidiscaviarum]QDP79188.1 TIR domain-containing protein [Nocardia otitidiscaviarum]